MKNKAPDDIRGKQTKLKPNDIRGKGQDANPWN